MILNQTRMLFLAALLGLSASMPRHKRWLEWHIFDTPSSTSIVHIKAYFWISGLKYLRCKWQNSAVFRSLNIKNCVFKSSVLKVTQNWPVFSLQQKNMWVAQILLSLLEHIFRTVKAVRVSNWMALLSFLNLKMTIHKAFLNTTILEDFANFDILSQKGNTLIPLCFIRT